MKLDLNFSMELEQEPQPVTKAPRKAVGRSYDFSPMMDAPEQEEGPTEASMEPWDRERQEKLEKALASYDRQRELEEDPTVTAITTGDLAKLRRLENEIQKGLLSGEDSYILLLKALEAVSLVSKDRQYLDYAKEKLQEVHGVGLEEPRPLSWAIEAREKKLNKIKGTLKRKGLSKATEERLRLSLEEIGREIANLKERLALAGQGELELH